MSANFSVDGSESDYMAGYIKGIATQVSTREHIDAAMDFTYRHLKNRYELAVDQTARLSQDRWHHVYEWGDTWETRKDNAGNPARRLWRLTQQGTGPRRTVGFTFLPSVKPSPIHPEEEKRGVEADKHIFTWKAPVMEYGMQVRIEPVEALKGMLVFYWEKLGKVVATKKTIITRPDPNVRGVFTGHFYMWWSEVAPTIFETDIRPRLERDIAPPRDSRGRFVKRGKLVNQRVSIRTPDERRGERDAIKAMKRIAAGYEQGRGGYDNYGHE